MIKNVFYIATITISGAILTALVLLFSPLMMDGKYVIRDKAGIEFSCSDLIRDVKSGEVTSLHEHHPRLASQLSFTRRELVYDYEKSIGYRFTQCRDEIEIQTENWCKEKVKSFHKEDIHEFFDKHLLKCNFKSKDEIINTYENQRFDIAEGKKPRILFKSRWVNIEDVEIWKPFYAHSPENGLWNQCVSYDGFAYCRSMKSEEDATSEMNRLLEFTS